MATDMGKMIGPLPLGAWIAVVAGGLGFMVYTRNQSAATDTTATDTTAVEDTSGVPGVGDGTVGGWVDTTPSTQPSTPVTPAITDNESWGVAAENTLIAKGYDPAVSDSAIRKYLDGGQLSSQEYALIKIVLGLLGATPQIMPAPVFAPPSNPVVPKAPPPKKATPPPAKKANNPRYYTVVKGDSLWAIANRFYHSGAKWPTIYNANRGVIGHNPNLIKPGQRLLIP